MLLMDTHMYSYNVLNKCQLLRASSSTVTSFKKKFHLCGTSRSTVIYIFFIFCFRFVIYVNNKKMNTDIDANDGTWHHVLVTWSSNRGAWKMYKNALLWDQGYNLAAGETIKGDFRLKNDFDNIYQMCIFLYIYEGIVYVNESSCIKIHLM